MLCVLLGTVVYQGKKVEAAPPCGETKWSEKPELICLEFQRTHTGGYVESQDATTRLGDGSAREPTKVVTSCDKSRGEA